MQETGESKNHFPITEIQQGASKSAQDFARQHLVTALMRMGYSVKTFEEAWGQLVAIQAEIAADPDNGSKATSAIKFVADAIGISAKGGDVDSGEAFAFPDLSLDEAEQLLAWLASEMADTLNQESN